MPSKTTLSWLFNAVCYLFIASFDWKVGVLQQIVVRVYYILKKQFDWNLMLRYTVKLTLN